MPTPVETEELTITIGGVNYTAYATWEEGGCSYELSTSDRQGSGTFTFLATTSAARTALNVIASGQTIVVANTTPTTLFSGIVSEVRRKPVKGTQVVFYVINAEGMGTDPVLEDAWIISRHNFVGSTDKAIIQHLFGHYAPTYNVATYVNNLDTIAYISFFRCTLATMMTRICDATGGEWYVDALKKIHYYDPAGAGAAPFALSDSGAANVARYQEFQEIEDADGNLTYEVSTLVAGFLPGQACTVVNSLLAVSASYGIRNVQASALPLPQWVFSYHITLGAVQYRDAVDYLADVVSGGGGEEKTGIGHGHGGDYDGAQISYNNLTGTPAAHDAVTLATDADTLLGLSTQQLTLDTQSRNLVFCSADGVDGQAPSFRALVAAEIPQLSHSSLSDVTADQHHAQSHTHYVQPSSTWLTEPGGDDDHTHVIDVVEVATTGTPL